jgi:beta-fructofuranosidase
MKDPLGVWKTTHSMPLLPKDHLLWDFWFAPYQPGEPLHVFCLRVPLSIADPEDCHWQAEVGHAVSRDFHTWEDQGLALAPSLEPSWDDKAIWTGSIINHNGWWYWFYTAFTHTDHEQRIGLATSDDLFTWSRHPENPLLLADTAWCETGVSSVDGHVAFRDPWVMPDPDSNGWLMYITTRVNRGPVDGRGVIALARSPNLVDWVLEGPVTDDGQFAEMEVPQVLSIEEDSYLLFCTGKPSAARLVRPDASPWIGTHYLVGDRVAGPWTLAPEPPLCADPPGSWYAGRAVRLGETWYFYAWRRSIDGQFVGGLSDPAPLARLPDGRLHIDASQLG